MRNEEKITLLTSIWYKCLIDHHKDRDCHFKISKKWSYGKLPIYCVEHYGYIIDEIYGEFNTLEGAEEYLIKELSEYINIEIDRWLDVCNDKENWDNTIALKHEEKFKLMKRELNGINKN